MKYCGALLSPSTYCCSTFPCQGSMSWRIATSDVTLFGAAWQTTTSLFTCCVDGIDGRLGRAAFQGSKLCFNFFCFCVCTPRTHTRLCGQFVLINLYTRWYLVIKIIGCSHFQACQVYLLWFLVSWKLGICSCQIGRCFLGTELRIVFSLMGEPAISIPTFYLGFKFQGVTVPHIICA